jgi:hypothetical protein
MRMLRDRGHRTPPGLQLQQGQAPDGRPLHVWQAAHAAYNAALAEGATSEAASSAAAIAAATASGKPHDGNSSSSSLLEAEHQQTEASLTSSSSERVAAAAAAAATSAVSVGPSLVLEQAVGVVCMLVHNPDNHFAMVGEGLVPLLVSLLHKGGQSSLLICSRVCCSCYL